MSKVVAERTTRRAGAAGLEEGSRPLAGVKLIEAAKKIHQARFSERVKDLRSPAVIREDTHVAQHGEVIRNRGHIQSDKRGDFRHAPLPLSKGVHHEQAIGITQSLEHLRGLSEVRGRFALTGFWCGRHTWKLFHFPK
jgi:hypothetical protein